MSCRLYEEWCQDRLDHREPLRPELDSSLTAHLSTCVECRDAAARYGLLSDAISGWSDSVRPRADLADRILSNPGHLQIAAHRAPLLVKLLPYAAAAAVLAMGVIGSRYLTTDDAGPEQIAQNDPPLAPLTPPPSLSLALADVTAATLELARRTTEPATRAGSQALADARLPSRPEPLSLPVRPPTGLLDSVGEGVNRGVKPLSGSARHAFGFLLAPLVREKPTEVRPSNGA
jgi:hypothetical protein